MPRLRTVPDATIYAAIRNMLAAEGEKAVAFGSVARVIGLAASTLVQRYGNRDNMVRAALLDAWDALDAATLAAEGEEGANAYLKALGADSQDAVQLGLLVMDFRDPLVKAR
ncbi:MAG: transcriptional regulator, partial [Rhodobacteraceae bacterium]|nr:transcriptional regulator [Paracoccaceae bacterium]